MTRYIIGGAIVVVFVVWGTMAFLKTTIQYVSLDEARRARSTVQAIGKIDFDRVRYNVDQSRLEFEIYDPEATDVARASRLAVHYYGVVPGNFDQATSVVVRGKPGEDVFVADQILVKCPSKYQGEQGDQYQDFRKHDEAVGGNSASAGK
jgi:cytochrome c-type biogenesis protein CcmE